MIVQGPTAVAATETPFGAHTIGNTRHLCRSTRYLLLPPSTQSMYAATCFIAARNVAREGEKKNGRFPVFARGVTLFFFSVSGGIPGRC